jgi:hypothetical protein
MGKGAQNGGTSEIFKKTPKAAYRRKLGQSGHLGPDPETIMLSNRVAMFFLVQYTKT